MLAMSAPRYQGGGVVSLDRADNRGSLGQRGETQMRRGAHFDNIRRLDERAGITGASGYLYLYVKAGDHRCMIRRALAAARQLVDAAAVAERRQQWRRQDQVDTEAVV